MKTGICLFILLSAVPRPAPAEIETKLAASEALKDEVLKEIEERLLKDEPAARGLARRLLNSSLKSYFGGISDREEDLDRVVEWIRANPHSAARLAFGFAQDDAEGTSSFESSLYERVIRYYRVNPNATRGLLGTLLAAGQSSAELLKLEGMDEEQSRDAVKRFFEGESTTTGKTPTGPPGGRPPGSSGGPPGSGSGSSSPALAASGPYDRLTAANLKGHSPEVLYLQSAYNARRIPGAPKLVETGRLDYETIRFPFYELSHDLKNLEAGLGQLRSRVMGKNSHLLGTYLLKGNSPSLRVEQELRKAREALARFEEEARAFQDLSRVNLPALKALGSRQREAARRVNAAWIGLEAATLDELSSFMTPELLRLIRRASVYPEVREAYEREADGLQERIEASRRELKGIEELLGREDYLSRIAEIESRTARTGRTRRKLRRDIRQYVTTPYKLHEAHVALLQKSWWRELLDSLILRFLPSSRWARQIRDEKAAFAFQSGRFAGIASGRYLD